MDREWRVRLVGEPMVAELEILGITSVHLDFESKKNEILSKTWSESDKLNVRELGFVDMDDFTDKATATDKNDLKEKWH